MHVGRDAERIIAKSATYIGVASASVWRKSGDKHGDESTTAGAKKKVRIRELTVGL